jgi:uncharacterized damage-inducible protein DinB
MTTLHQHLERRIAASYRQLRRSLEGLTEQEARHGASRRWRRYRFGTGLDGSIAGIVWHVAAWKHVLADGLDSGVFPDVEAVLPHEAGWAGLVAWLEGGHVRLLRALEEARPEELDRTLSLEGESLAVHELIAVVIEHDQYHAGQANLLRQQMGHELSDD